MLDNNEVLEVTRLKWLAANHRDYIDFASIEWVCDLAIRLNTDLKNMLHEVHMLQGQVQQMEADCESWDREQRYP